MCFLIISVPCGTGDIADAMIYAPHMIYALRMKLNGYNSIFAQQIYHACEASISYGFCLDDIHAGGVI